MAPVELESPVPTTRIVSELPSVENTVETVGEHTEAQVPTALGNPVEPNAVERSRHDLTSDVLLAAVRMTLTARRMDTLDLRDSNATSCSRGSRASRESGHDHLQHVRPRE